MAWDELHPQCQAVVFLRGRALALTGSKMEERQAVRDADGGEDEQSGRQN